MGVLIYTAALPDAGEKLAFVLTNNILLPLPIIALYYGLMNERTFVSKILSTRFFILMGKSSYVTYLLHTIIIDYIYPPSKASLLIDLHWNIYVIGVLTVTCLASIIIYKQYEAPVNKFIRRSIAVNGTKN